MSISEHGEFIYFQKVVFQLNFLTFIEFFIKDSANTLFWEWIKLTI